MTRYHPALVAIHWLMALMILAGLFFGKFVLAGMSNADPEKVQGLAGHMTTGWRSAHCWFLGSAFDTPRTCRRTPKLGARLSTGSALGSVSSGCVDGAERDRHGPERGPVPDRLRRIGPTAACRSPGACAPPRARLRLQPADPACAAARRRGPLPPVLPARRPVPAHVVRQAAPDRESGNRRTRRSWK